MRFIVLAFYFFSFLCCNEHTTSNTSDSFKLITDENLKDMYLRDFGLVSGSINFGKLQGVDNEMEFSIQENSKRNIIINIPHNWSNNENKTQLFISYLSDSKEDYFTIVSQNKSTLDHSLDGLVNYAIEVLNKDTIEVAKNIIVSSDTIANGIYLEAELEKKDMNFLSYSYFTEYDNELYEFSIKFRNDEKRVKLFSAVLRWIVETVHIGHTRIFNPENKNVKIERSKEF